ncbi:MAG: Fe(2+)-trafficking protein [Planctomycetota bacterium]
MDTETRIAQFEKMASDDPDNDMAHFSLGNAYQQAGRFAEAAESFLRCVELNDAMSKGYQLAGAALMASEQTERAKDVLLRGFVSSGERGDLMPQRAIGDMLDQLGVERPEVEAKQPDDIPEGTFMCQRTGKPGTQLARPPFKGPVGDYIYENISKQTFDAWIAQGTKVINELRLDLSRDEDSATYDSHMREYLGIDEALAAEGGS